MYILELLTRIFRQKIFVPDLTSVVVLGFPLSKIEMTYLPGFRTTWFTVVAVVAVGVVVVPCRQQWIWCITVYIYSCVLSHSPGPAQLSWFKVVAPVCHSKATQADSVPVTALVPTCDAPVVPRLPDHQHHEVPRHCCRRPGGRSCRQAWRLHRWTVSCQDSDVSDIYSWDHV